MKLSNNNSLYDDNQYAYYSYKDKLTLNKLKELNRFSIYGQINESYFINVKSESETIDECVLVFFKNENKYFDDDRSLFINRTLVEYNIDHRNHIIVNQEDYNYAIKQPLIIDKDDYDKEIIGLYHPIKPCLDRVSRLIMAITNTILIDQETYDKTFKYCSIDETIYTYLKRIGMNNNFVKKL